MARFLYIVNGDFIAREETTGKDGNPMVNYYTVSFIPVKAPGFTDPIALDVQSGPDKFFQLLFTVTEDSNNVVHTRFYSVRKTDIQRSYQSHDGVLYLPLDADIQHLAKCDALFEEDENGTFSGFWEDCMDIKEGEKPLILIHWTCDTGTVKLDWGSRSVVQKYYVRNSDRYPQPPEIQNKMKSTEDPCQL